jgi:hypothetical protein
MSLPEPNPRVLSRRLVDEVVLVNLDTNQIYALNETGARFWELLAETRDQEFIEAALQAEFDVTGPELNAEIDRLVAEFASLGLVQPT